MSLRRLTSIFALSTALLVSAQEPQKPAFEPAPEKPRRPTATIDSIKTVEPFWSNKFKFKSSDTTAAKSFRLFGGRKKAGGTGPVQFGRGFDGIYVRPNIKPTAVGLKDARLGILNVGPSNPMLNYTVFPTAEKDSALIAKRQFNEFSPLLGIAVDLGTKDVTVTPALGYSPENGFVFGANAGVYANVGGEYQTYFHAHAFFGSVPASASSVAAKHEENPKTTGLLNYGFGVDRFLGGDNTFNNLYMSFQSYGRPGEDFDIGAGFVGSLSERHHRATIGHERTLACLDVMKGSYDITGGLEMIAQRDAVVRDYGQLNFRHVDASVAFGAAAVAHINLGSSRLGIRAEQGFTKDEMNPKSSGTSVAISWRKNLRDPNQRIGKTRARF